MKSPLPAILIACVFCFQANAQTTYLWNPQGGSTSAKVVSNWKIATCNGSTATVFPGSTDTLVFSNCSAGNATIDTNITVRFVNVKSSYSGTVTLSGSNTFTTEKMRVTGGTFSGGSGTINVSSSLSIDGGIFYSTFGTFTLAGNFTKSSGTFNHNNGTVVFKKASSGQPTIAGSSISAAVDFYDVIFDAPDATTLFNINSIYFTVNHSLTISGDEQLFINGDTVLMAGSSNLTLSNTSGTGGGTADIKFNSSSTQTITGSTGSDYTKLPNIIIAKSGTLNLSGNIGMGGTTYLDYRSGTIAEGSSSFLFYHDNTIKGKMEFYDVEFQGHSSDYYLTDTIVIGNDLLMTGTAVNTVNNGVIKLNKDLTYNNTHSSSIFNTPIEFSNTSIDQAIQGSALARVYKLTINKINGGNVVLTNPTTVIHSLVLENGFLITDATNLLTLSSSCTVTGGDATTFVKGPVKKVGNSAFVFPIGAGAAYKPLAITQPSSASDAFTAQFFNTVQTEGSAKDSLTYISACEYWSLSQTSGSSSVKVTLSWDENSCDIYTLSTLKVGRWDGSKWNNTGVTTTTGTTTGGTVQTNGNLGSFGYFVIGKRSPALYAYAGSDQEACGTTPVTIGATPVAAGGLTPYIYSWSPEMGLDDSTLSNPEARPGITTTYTLTVTDLDHTVTTDALQLTIYPGLIANAGFDGPVLTNGNRLLGGYPVVTGGTTPFNYEWSPSTALDDDNIEHPMANPTSEISYTLTITDDNNCEASDNVVVNVMPVDLGAAAEYALLAGGSIIATNEHYAIGKVGSETSLSSSIHATEGTAINTAPVNNALDDVTQAISDIESMTGYATLSSNLSGLTLEPGLYRIINSAVLDGILKLEGDINSSFLIVVNDTFLISSGSQMVLSGILPEQVFIVAEDVIAAGTVDLRGVFLTLENFFADTILCPIQILSIGQIGFDDISVNQSYYKGLNPEITLSVGVFKAFNNDFLGFNGMETTNDYGWSTIDDENRGLPHDFPRLQPGTLRYPAGSKANVWDWYQGWYVESHFNSNPDDKTCPDFCKNTCPDCDYNRITEFKETLFPSGAHALFDINVVYSYPTAPLSVYSGLDDPTYQIMGLKYAQGLGIPLKYVELGNEFYLSGDLTLGKFPEATLYGEAVSFWGAQIKAEFGSNVKIGIVGALSEDKGDLRRHTWNSQLFNPTSTYSGISNCDAVSFHFYPPSGLGSVGIPDVSEMYEFFGNLYQNISCLRNDISKIPPTIPDVWITEYNLDDPKVIIHGTWAQGLWVGVAALMMMEEPRIKLALLHNMFDKGIRGATFKDDNGFSFYNNENEFNFYGDEKTEKWQFTAMGNVMNLLNEVIRNSDQSAQIMFEGQLSTLYPELYGWQFRNSQTGAQQSFIVNMSHNIYKLKVDQLFSVGSYCMYYADNYEVNKATTPMVWIFGDASISGFTSVEAPDIPAPTCIIEESSISGNLEIEMKPFSVIKIFGTDPVGYPVITSSVSELCTNERAILTASGGTPPYIWSKTGPGNIIEDGDNVCVYIPPDVPGSYSATITVADANLYEDDFDLTLKQSPYIVWAADNEDICAEPIILTVSDFNTTSIVSKSWYPDDTYIVVDGSGNATFTEIPIPDPATYLLTMTNADGCADAKPYRITINKTPFYLAGLQNSYSMPCTDKVTIEARGYDNVILPTSAGTYSCSGCPPGFITPDTDINDSKAILDFSLFSNPAPESFVISFVYDEDCDYTLSEEVQLHSFSIDPQNPNVCIRNDVTETPVDYNDHGVVLSIAANDAKEAIYSWTTDDPNAVVKGKSTASPQIFPAVTSIPTTTVATVEITLPDGSICIASTNIYSVACTTCTPVVSNYEYATVKSSQLINQFTNTSQVSCTENISNVQQIVINNALIIDQDIAIEGFGTGCSTADPQTSIVFGTDATITFAGPYKLTFSNCHLRACDDEMWSGILVDVPGAEIVINAGSIVEDAISAIHAKNGGRFELDNVTFNKNYKHLLVEDYDDDAPYLGVIRGCTFECETVCAGTAETMLSPHAGERTYAAIEINNVNNIQIGDPYGEQNLIIVYDNFGIKSSASGVTAFNNHITYYDGIVSPGFCFPSCDVPYNIYATGGALENTIIIGGENENEGNLIENGYYGIYAQNNLNAYINYNTFTNMGKPVFVTKLNIPGVSSGHTIDISNNLISDCHSGINVTANEEAAITINENSIHLVESDNTLIGPTGIAVIEPAGEYLPGDNDVVMISNNDITGVQTGILINSVGSPTTIQQNSIEFDVLTEFSNLKAYGIHVIKTDDLIILGNENITSLEGGDNTRGIQVDNSNHYSIQSNIISNCGRGVVAYGNGTMGFNTYLTCNEMVECEYGFLLDANANIGSQGDATHPSNNTWTPNGYYDLGNTNGSFHTWSESSFGGFVIFHTLTSNIFQNDNNGAGNGLPIFNNIATGSDDCPEIFDPPLEFYEDVARGIISYSGDTVKAKWLAKQTLFNLLRRDSTLLDSSMILSNFYDTTLTQNIGKIREIRKKIREGISETDPDLFDEADYSNSILSALNVLDANHKTVNQIYLNTLAAGVDVFTEEQLEELETIAQMCYYEGGDASYQAMALLSYAYHTPVFYDCEEIELKVSATADDNFVFASVHPNPTSNLLTIENYCKDKPLDAELVNEIGITILKKSIASGPSQEVISLSNQPAGLYLLRLIGCESTMQQLIVKIQ